MDEADRNKILLNLTSLVEGISFDELFNQLRSKGMFNDYMQNEIMTKEGTKKLKFLYWYVTTRGPGAFNQLVEALQETNHRDLAALLTHRPSRVHPFLNGNSSSQLSLEEEYPYDEEWTVVRGDPVRDVFDNDMSRVYKMRSSPRGLALIINVRSYVNGTMEEREGSEKDVARLESILPQLGYEVIVAEQNLTGDGMRDKVYEFSQHSKHCLYDSAMVFIMSHGRDRQDGSKTVLIAGSDIKLVNCYELVDMLSARACDALRGKPKMFFFQTCRGNNFNHPVKLLRQNGARVEIESPEAEVEGLRNGAREEIESLEAEIEELMRNGDSVDVPERQTLQTDGVIVGKTDVVRSDSDIFIGHATSPGMLSMRDPDNGSWYIQTLCRVFARDAWHEDLHTMLQTVMQEKNRLGLGADLYIEESNQGFNRLLYFQPGICFGPSPIKLLNGS